MLFFHGCFSKKNTVPKLETSRWQRSSIRGLPPGELASDRIVLPMAPFRKITMMDRPRGFDPSQTKWIIHERFRYHFRECFCISINKSQETYQKRHLCHSFIVTSGVCLPWSTKKNSTAPGHKAHLRVYRNRHWSINRLWSITKSNNLYNIPASSFRDLKSGVIFCDLHERVINPSHGWKKLVHCLSLKFYPLVN